MFNNGVLSFRHDQNGASVSMGEDILLPLAQAHIDIDHYTHEIIRLCNNAVSEFLTEDERRDIAQAADYYWRKSEYNASIEQSDFRTRVVSALDALVAEFEVEAKGNAVNESILDRIANLMMTIERGDTAAVPEDTVDDAVGMMRRDMDRNILAVAGDDGDAVDSRTPDEALQSINTILDNAEA